MVQIYIPGGRFQRGSQLYPGLHSWDDSSNKAQLSELLERMEWVEHKSVTQGWRLLEVVEVVTAHPLQRGTQKGLEDLPERTIAGRDLQAMSSGTCQLHALFTKHTN